MSHLPQRKQKDCLNCGTHVIGHFCHKCGQQNIEPKESVWHLVTHFFNDITHFDGKFFSSLKHLFFKPGFLSKEYMIGRRVTYLNPIRMYLFTSAFFFLIFFSLYKVEEKDLDIKSTIWGKSADEINKMDSAKLSQLTKKVNKGKALSKQEVIVLMDSVNTFSIASGKFKSRQEYDSILRSGAKKHNWFQRQLVYKDFALKEKYGNNSSAIIAALINKFISILPQMLFVMLPLLALILKLIYVRRKQFYYVDHLIFTIHLYIVVFLMMLLTFGISKMRDVLDWSWLRYINIILILSMFFYFYKALRNFYKQRRAKTIFKYFILLFLFFIATLLMFTVFTFFSLFAL